VCAGDGPGGLLVADASVAAAAHDHPACATARTCTRTRTRTRYDAAAFTGRAAGTGATAGLRDTARRGHRTPARNAGHGESSIHVLSAARRST